MSIFNLKLKQNTWFLRVGPFQSLIPATWKGALIYIGTIVGGILLANASVTAARGGAKSDAELYGFGFVVVLLLFFIVGYKKVAKDVTPIDIPECGHPECRDGSAFL